MANKGYWILHADVLDLERFERYRVRLLEALANHEHRYLVRAGRGELVEGQVRGRTVIIEFPSYELALACWDDPGVSAARAVRQRLDGGLPAAHVDGFVCEGLCPGGA